MACIFVNANRSVGTINPNIYGQFSEHLGRCIYQGIYVGQASDIPNTNGMRNDVVSALKALHVPVLRWPGGCFADTYHWRRHWPQGEPQNHCKHQLGRRDRG